MPCLALRKAAMGEHKDAGTARFFRFVLSKQKIFDEDINAERDKNRGNDFFLVFG